ncbi:SUMO ligase siz1 [Chytriomyces hyalinus]|nr:SUMO ligase siz1 [Chytriomyces hyalinus]
MDGQRGVEVTKASLKSGIEPLIEVDSQSVMATVSRLRVPELKQVLRQLSERVGGTRADLIARIQFVCSQRSGNPERFGELVRIVDSVGNLRPTPSNAWAAPAHTSTSSTTSNSPAMSLLTSAASNSLLGPSASITNVANSYGASSLATSQLLSAHSAKLPLDSIKFRSSPFYAPTTRLMMKTVSCDTGRATFRFPLNSDHVAKIAAGEEAVLLMVGPANGVPLKPNPFKASGIPLEYPPLEGPHSNAPNHCHIFVNAVHIPSAQYAGIRGKPWTAKPLDMSKLLQKAAGVGNSLELRYTPAHRSVIVCVQLAKPISVRQIVEDAKRDTLISKEQILSERKFKISGDDDICLTEEHVSLKDPVTRCRINTPARSRQCRHPQCFDLEYYLQLNQTHPTWMCPVCNKLAPINEVFVDGFFTDLLGAAADNADIESAEISPDGTWRLNKEEATGVCSDSSDDEAFYAKNESKATAPPILSNASNAPQLTVSNNVIDLTLSDDERPSRPRPVPSQQEQQHAANGQPVNKRPRIDERPLMSNSRPIASAENSGLMPTSAFSQLGNTLSYHSDASVHNPPAPGVLLGNSVTAGDGLSLSGANPTSSAQFGMPSSIPQLNPQNRSFMGLAENGRTGLGLLETAASGAFDGRGVPSVASNGMNAWSSSSSQPSGGNVSYLQQQHNTLPGNNQIHLPAPHSEERGGQLNQSQNRLQFSLGSSIVPPVQPSSVRFGSPAMVLPELRALPGVMPPLTSNGPDNLASTSLSGRLPSPFNSNSMEFPHFNIPTQPVPGYNLPVFTSMQPPYNVGPSRNGTVFGNGGAESDCMRDGRQESTILGGWVPTNALNTDTAAQYRDTSRMSGGDAEDDLDSFEI